jgi:large subunit ribosomal protein L24e
MKRNPRKVQWTKAFRKAAGKDLTIDSTFEFEKRRNVPVRYDRELMASTVKAVSRVLEIRRQRQQQFIKNRLKSDQTEITKLAVAEVEKGVDLVMAPTSAQRKVQLEKVRFVKEQQMDTNN